MRFYEKNELSPFVVLNTEVVEAEWLDLEGLWKVTLRNRKDGTTFADKCNVMINGSGVLTKWKWPVSLTSFRTSPYAVYSFRRESRSGSIAY